MRTVSNASDLSIYSTAEAKPRRIFEINTAFERNDSERWFCSNAIRTSKYTCLNFFPINLFEQFSKMANFYFLIMFCLELIPGIGTQGGAVTTIMPLGFVVGLSMIKDGYEDRKRDKQDRAENTRTC